MEAQHAEFVPSADDFPIEKDFYGLPPEAKIIYCNFNQSFSPSAHHPHPPNAKFPLLLPRSTPYSSTSPLPLSSPLLISSLPPPPLLPLSSSPPSGRRRTLGWVWLWRPGIG
eukprot:499849-Hanusia_phi.AAC.1